MVFHEINLGIKDVLKLAVSSCDSVLLTLLDVSNTTILYYPIMFAGIIQCLTIHHRLQISVNTLTIKCRERKVVNIIVKYSYMKLEKSELVNTILISTAKHKSG